MRSAMSPCRAKMSFTVHAGSAAMRCRPSPEGCGMSNCPQGRAHLIFPIADLSGGKVNNWEYVDVRDHLAWRCQGD